MEQKGLRPLSGKVILVTGASRGIGAAAARRVAQGGATVVVNYHQNRERALAVLQEVEKEGGKGMVFQADVTQRKQVEEMARVAEYYAKRAAHVAAGGRPDDDPREWRTYGEGDHAPDPAEEAQSEDGRGESNHSQRPGAPARASREGRAARGLDRGRRQ